MNRKWIGYYDADFTFPKIIVLISNRILSSFLLIAADINKDEVALPIVYTLLSPEETVEYATVLLGMR